MPNHPTTRAERRAIREHRVNRAISKMIEWWFTPEQAKQFAPKWADNMRKCSCRLCKRGVPFSDIRRGRDPEPY